MGIAFDRETFLCLMRCSDSNECQLLPIGSVAHRRIDLWCLRCQGCACFCLGMDLFECISQPRSRSFHLEETAVSVERAFLGCKAIRQTLSQSSYDPDQRR